MEPKYKVHQWVETKNGDIFRIDVVDCRDTYGLRDNDGNIEVAYEDSYGGAYRESSILHAVHITPIVDKPKCKDCQCYHVSLGVVAYLKDCPVDDWCTKAGGGFPGEWRVKDTLDLEPPDGSTCFRQKEPK